MKDVKLSLTREMRNVTTRRMKLEVKKKTNLQMLFGCCKKMLNFTVLQKTRSKSTGAENAAGYKKK